MTLTRALLLKYKQDKLSRKRLNLLGGITSVSITLVILAMVALYIAQELVY